MKLLKNIFNFYYTEKDAIRGHSVDRYHYAVQLIDENLDHSLIKAFAWLSLAADEVDMFAKANQLSRKLEFELKQRQLHAQALKIESEYREKYSADALRKKIENSRNPLYALMRYCIKIIE